MPAVMRLSVKEANDLADHIERNGGNADSLRSAIEEVNNASNRHSSVPAQRMNDEEHVQMLRSKSDIETGVDLECQVCHEFFDHLISGACEICFRQWALSTKRG